MPTDQDDAALNAFSGEDIDVSGSADSDPFAGMHELSGGPNIDLNNGDISEMVNGVINQQQATKQAQQEQPPQQEPQQEAQQEPQQEPQQKEEGEEKTKQEASGEDDEQNSLDVDREQIVEIKGEDGQVKEVKIGELIDSYDQMNLADEEMVGGEAETSPDVYKKVTDTHYNLLREQGVFDAINQYNKSLDEFEQLRERIGQLRQITKQAPRFDPNDPIGSQERSQNHIENLTELQTANGDFTRMRDEIRQMKSVLDSTKQESMFASLEALWPELSNPATRQQEMTKIQKLMANYGFNPKELKEITDPRSYMLARDALRYHTMKDSAKANAAKTTAKPTRLKVTQAGAAPNKAGISANRMREIRSSVLSGEGKVGLKMKDIDDLSLAG